MTKRAWMRDWLTVSEAAAYLSRALVPQPVREEDVLRVGSGGHAHPVGPLQAPGIGRARARRRRA